MEGFQIPSVFSYPEFGISKLEFDFLNEFFNQKNKKKCQLLLRLT